MAEMILLDQKRAFPSISEDYRRSECKNGPARKGLYYFTQRKRKVLQDMTIPLHVALKA